MKKLKITLLVVPLVILAGCETIATVDRGLYTTAEGVAGHDRVTGDRTLNIASRQKQIEKSNASSLSRLQEYDTSGKKRDAALNADTYVRLLRITMRILAVSHMQTETWTIVLLDDDQFNAFTEGGTYIFVYSGLVKDIKDDDELAAILGHELAHVAANHVYEHSANSKLSALSKKHKKPSSGFEAAFTVTQEIEADRIGILYAALAGFDPFAASRVWARLYSAQGNFRNGYTDHPVNSDRAEQTQAVAEKVKSYYTAERQNLQFTEILENNTLWHKKTNKDVAAGKGGGFLATLDAAANSYNINAKAKAEQRKQELLLNDLAALRAGATVAGVQPVDAHTVRLWLDYRGPNIQANETVYSLKLQTTDGAEYILKTTLRGWMVGNRRYIVDFNDPQLQANSIQSQKVELRIEDILR